LEFTSIRARKRAVVSFLAYFLFRTSFFALSHFPLQFFRQFRAYSSVFMTPLTALIEHVISGLLALTQGVDALHRMIWHDMALADDTQPISTIGRR